MILSSPFDCCWFKMIFQVFSTSGSPPCRINPISRNFDDSPKLMGINSRSSINLLLAMKTLYFPSSQRMMVNSAFFLNSLLLSFKSSEKEPRKTYLIGNLSWTWPFFPLTCDFLVIYSRSKNNCDIDGVTAMFATL